MRQSFRRCRCFTCVKTSDVQLRSDLLSSVVISNVEAESAKVTVTGDAVFLQTSPATWIQDSPRVVTSSPKIDPARGEALDPETLDSGLFHLFSLFLCCILDALVHWPAQLTSEGPETYFPPIQLRT